MNNLPKSIHAGQQVKLEGYQFIETVLGVAVPAFIVTDGYFRAGTGKTVGQDGYEGAVFRTAQNRINDMPAVGP